MVKHIIADYNIPDLITTLDELVDKGECNKTVSHGLIQYTYSKDAQYKCNWTPELQIARGIIFDENQKLVALPFAKFFNYGENNTFFTDDEILNATCYDKLDGSLIITYFHNGEWQCNTKGSFYSEQAIWAKEYINNYIDTAGWPTHVTFLFECIYESNKIVCNYDWEGLVILGAYDNITYEEYPYLGLMLGFNLSVIRTCKVFNFYNLNEIKRYCEDISYNTEGVVLRTVDGRRAKFKGREYLLYHKTRSDFSPLSVWEALSLNKGNELRYNLPEEMWDEFDSLSISLNKAYDNVYREALDFYHNTKYLSDKELGLQLTLYKTNPIKNLVWLFRKNVDKIENRIWKLVRPNYNVIEMVN